MNVLFHDLQTQIANTLKPLSETQTQAAPQSNPEKWTIQQTIEHLLLTYQTTSTAFEVRLTRRRPTLARSTLAERLFQFTTLTCGLYPPGLKAPPEHTPTRPLSLRTGAELAFRIHSDLIRLDALLTKAESVFAQRRAVLHPVLGPLTAAQWRRFHILHGRHHLSQIRRILATR